MLVSRNAAVSVLGAAAAASGCEKRRKAATMILVPSSPVDPRAMMYGPECSPAKESRTGAGKGVGERDEDEVVQETSGVAAAHEGDRAAFSSRRSQAAPNRGVVEGKLPCKVCWRRDDDE
jgi:hypothetical protein